jgi:protoporphyrinogen/coproporphyrinogen III oxidase
VIAQRRVAVIGGGVSGLATAYHLTAGSRRSPSAVDRGTELPGSGGTGPEVIGSEERVPEVIVLEADRRLGGKVATEQVAGLPVDTGPDAVLVRAPVADRTLTELGLDPLRRAPAGTGAFVWARGRLRPLPVGSVFGVPDRLWPLLRSGLVGPVGFVRAGADLVLPRPARPDDDPTIEQLLRPRFGRQVFENLIEPMLGGVHAGRASRLSARSAVPEVMALAAGRRSLYLALRNRRSAATAGSGGPALVSLDGGLERLIDALSTAVLAAPGARVLTGVRVTSVQRSGHGYLVLADGIPPLAVDDVVIATPAWEAARLLGPLAPAAAEAAGAIPHAGVATVTFGYPPEAVGRPLVGTGFLVPPAQHRLLVGCSWLTAKWPQLRSDRVVLLRCMVGRDGDQAWADLDDAELAAAVRSELAASMGVHGEPVAVHIRRMPRAMPQYTVGHADRLAAIAAALVGLPGVQLTGAGYRGVGIAGCLSQAEAAAAAVLNRSLEQVTA